MGKILKPLAYIYGVLGTIGSIFLAWASGSKIAIIIFLILELSVITIVVVLLAVVNILDNTDELLYYAHKTNQPQKYTYTQPVYNPGTPHVSNAKMAEVNQDGKWKCKKCGTINEKNTQYCKDCGSYK